MERYGMGGPGSGSFTQPMGLPLPAPQPMSLQEMLHWLQFQGAAGYGMGPYGYPLAYGVSPAGEQNKLLNEQWGWFGFGHPR